MIVVNWNSGTTLKKCLACLFSQTLLPGKIIVVDNASTDGSLGEITDYLHRIRLIRLNDNIGFAEANNIGVREAEGFKWIALINPDAFADPDWLKELLEAADQYPGYSFFGCRMLSAEQNGLLDGTADIYHVSGKYWRRGHGERASDRFNEIEEIFSPCAAAALYKREAFVHCGGFDGAFFCYSEDIDLGFRLRLLGYRCLYVPAAVVQHVGSAVTGRSSDFTVYYGHRNIVWTFIKNMPWPLFWLYLPQHIMLNVVSIFWFIIKRQGKVVLRAKKDALMGIPRILNERRKIQKIRRVGAWEIRQMMSKGLFQPYIQAIRLFGSPMSEGVVKE